MLYGGKVHRYTGMCLQLRVAPQAELNRVVHFTHNEHKTSVELVKLTQHWCPLRTELG